MFRGQDFFLHPAGLFSFTSPTIVNCSVQYLPIPKHVHSILCHLLKGTIFQDNSILCVNLNIASGRNISSAVLITTPGCQFFSKCTIFIIFLTLTFLFPGDTINQVMNDNWRDLIKELGPPYTKAVANKVHEIINKLYKNVPLNELFAP